MTPWYRLVHPGGTHLKGFVTTEHDLKGFVPEAFERGQPVEGWDESAWLQAADPVLDGLPDDVLCTDLPLVVFSRRLREALEAAGIGGIQYLPIRVLRSDGSNVPGYCIANVLNFVSALDWERSEYNLWGDDDPSRRDEIRDLRTVHLKRTALRSYDLIRLREYDVALFGSERLRRLFQGRQFTGFSFWKGRVHITEDLGPDQEGGDTPQEQLPLDFG